MIEIFRATNETLTPLDVSAESLDDATLKTGHGVYSVFRLYHDAEGRRCTLRLDRHLDRMRRSAAAIDLPFPHTNADLRAALRSAVDAAAIALPRIRVTVPFAAPADILMALEPYTPPPPEVYRDGVAVGLAAARRANPLVKDSRFIETRQQLYRSASTAYEIMLVDDQGRILEGSGSNFYAILKGELRTAEVGMLEGIARSILLEVAPSILPVRFEAVRLADLPALSEAFLTSSSRGVLPIVRIGDQVVGAGTPGPLTARLSAAYDACLRSELEPL